MTSALFKAETVVLVKLDAGGCEWGHVHLKPMKGKGQNSTLGPVTHREKFQWDPSSTNLQSQFDSG